MSFSINSMYPSSAVSPSPMAISANNVSSSPFSTMQNNTIAPTPTNSDYHHQLYLFNRVHYEVHQQENMRPYQQYRDQFQSNWHHQQQQHSYGCNSDKNVLVVLHDHCYDGIHSPPSSVLNEQLLRALKERFAENPSILPAEREQMAGKFGIPSRRIKSWFEYERRKVKTKPLLYTEELRKRCSLKPVFSEQQRSALKQRFAKSDKIKQIEQQELAKRIGLTQQQVEKWFEKRRYNLKKMKKQAATANRNLKEGRVDPENSDY